MWEEEASSSTEAAGAAKNVDTKQQDAAFSELMQECKHSAPGARLSARLRTALERMRPEERRAVCHRSRDGCAPLFVACKRGNVEIVEYLVHVCAAELEQRGVYEVPDDRSVHTVTPLWCAAVAGRLEVLRVLADAGADLNACSGSGSTPVRSACFMTHFDVVKFLVERGADIHRPNHNGGTCLINSVQSVRLCTYLLEHGAEVDARDMQLKTALHYAIQEHRVESARLLLQHGANPRLASRAGDDALRTACLKGAAQIVSLLCTTVCYSPARTADAYELLGATQLDEFNDVASALASWRRATAIRHAYGEYIGKRPTRAPHEALGYAREWRSAAELEAAAEDMDVLRTQALLVAERVLGPTHKDTVFRLMYRGASYADAFRYQRCVDLWSWALEIRIEKDSLLYTDTCQTASALTRLWLDATGGRLERAQDLPRYGDVLRVFALLADHLPECRRALEARPVHKKQAETYDRALRCVTHLLLLLLRAEGASSGQQRAELRARLRRLLAADVRSAHTGDTLLHLAVSRLNVIRAMCFADEFAVPVLAEAPVPCRAVPCRAVPCRAPSELERLSDLTLSVLKLCMQRCACVDTQPVFPSVEVVSLLLQCGADPRQRNEARSTPLHVAAIPYNFSTELVERLLEGGAHLDQTNKFGDSAFELIALNRGSRVRPLRYLTLRCLAARVLFASGRRVPRRVLPATLYDFLQLHRA